jgi:site-specific DNA-methyltransferase (adenine-specific)
MIRDLHSAMQREKAPIGLFITATVPTRPMEKEAAAGRFEDGFGRTYPRLQIFTLAELFQGKKPDIPFVDPASVKRAKREDGSAGSQQSLL